jgi:hypothetical protein
MDQNRILLNALDSTAVKVHPDAHGAGKKRPAGDRENPRGWNTKLYTIVPKILANYKKYIDKESIIK